MPKTTELETLRRQLAEAQLQIAALEEDLERERRQRKLLQQMSHSLELEHLLYIFGQEVDRLEAFDGYVINFISPERNGLSCAKIRLPESHQGLADTYRGFLFPFDEKDPNTVAFRQLRTVHLDTESLGELQGLTRAAFERWQAQAMVVVPIPYGDHAIGTVMAFRQHGAIDAAVVSDFEQRLLLFNEHIRNALLFHELKQQEQEIQSALAEHRRFLEFVSEVNKLTSPELIYEAITREFVRAFGFDVAFLALAEDGQLAFKQFTALAEEHEPVCMALRQVSAEPLPLDRNVGAAAISVLQNVHIHLPDAQQVLHLPMAPRDKASLEAMGNARTVLQMPIRVRETPIGVMGLISLGECRPLEGNELKIIELLCGFVGTAISNAQLYSVIGNQKGQIEALNRELQDKIQQLDDMVRRDQLTGLHNFGAFRTELTRRVAEAQRETQNTGLSVVIIDVDHFKRFNDTYGHLAGNVVLREVAARIERASRTMDIPCRFGGEEFVVILPKCDPDGARVFGERVRTAIADTPFAVEDRTLPVTVSVGCATLRQGEGTEAVLERADQALYRAKESGRNRVEVAA